MRDSLSAAPSPDRQDPDLGQLYRELRAQHSDAELLQVFFARLAALLVEAEKEGA